MKPPDFGIDHPDDLALTVSAYQCDPLGIIRALRRGALVDVASGNGFTPLMWVAFRATEGFDPVVSARWLVAAGADVNRIGSKPAVTALTLACEMQSLDMVGYLLDNAADPDPPRYVESPLHNALPSVPIVRRLIAAGADPARRYKGQTALEAYVEGWASGRTRHAERDAAMARLLR